MQLMMKKKSCTDSIRRSKLSFKNLRLPAKGFAQNFLRGTELLNSAYGKYEKIRNILSVTIEC